MSQGGGTETGLSLTAAGGTGLRGEAANLQQCVTALNHDSTSTASTLCPHPHPTATPALPSHRQPAPPKTSLGASFSSPYISPVGLMELRACPPRVYGGGAPQRFHSSMDAAEELRSRGTTDREAGMERDEHDEAQIRDTPQHSQSEEAETKEHTSPRTKIGFRF